MINYTVVPAQKLHGEILVPGDKSVTHRAFILSSLAEGKSKLTGALEAGDCMNTMKIMTQLGVPITKIKSGEYEVRGVGLQGLRQSQTILDVGNSGTGIRLLTGLLAAQKFESQITGDASIQKRPMERVIKPLTSMGASITSQNGLAPLKIHAATQLHGITYAMPVSSAQVKSAIMLAALFAQGETVISDPGISRDHTERMFQLFDIPVQFQKGLVRVSAAKPFKAKNIVIPGDFSSAAFFMVAGLIHPNAEIKILNVGLNPSRAALLEVLKTMGANIQVELTSGATGEPTGNITVKSSQLKGIELSGEMISILIDEIPIFCVLASQASSQSLVKDAQELKVKESNRIASTVSELMKMGVHISATDDGMIIEPSPQIHGADVDSHGDHRIAMSCAILGLMAQSETTISDIECVNTSFPNFWSLLEKIC
jgi:3-phosphoshikimate 1-carboxyvinyltransferase